MLRPLLFALLILAPSARLPANEAVPLPESEARPPRAVREGGEAPAEGGSRTREGTLLKDVLGTFRQTGERLTFQAAEGEQRLIVLENLAVERVLRMLKESGGASQWLVSGVVTEFQGTNYLLVTRAILKHRKGSPLETPASTKKP
jgi:hypothetical protein